LAEGLSLAALLFGWYWLVDGLRVGGLAWLVVVLVAAVAQVLPVGRSVGPRLTALAPHSAQSRRPHRRGAATRLGEEEVTPGATWASLSGAAPTILVALALVSRRAGVRAPDIRAEATAPLVDGEAI
jgi:p-aminobenzoyl-glutamate transporter AbgT